MGVFSKIYKNANKQSKASLSERQQLTVAVWTPGGSDGCPVALELAGLLSRLTGGQGVIAELPCLGIPRLALHVDRYDKEKNTDKLLLDWERSEYQQVYAAQYLLPVSDSLAVLAINPYAAPDLPPHLKLNNLITLTDFPRYLKDSLFLEGYQYLIYLLQGQLHHPMTFFGLKESEQVIFTLNHPIELGWCLSCFKKLTEHYKERKEKFSLYATALEAKAIAGISSIKYLSSLESLINV
ncbi:MAG TPA: hypothetical protein PLJ33_07550 [Peptococcaceae bacterium]|jgi:hypothetical protein|nr:hypothetical protein [Clostridia bacterium]HOB82624.1 hypothetical protein [Peptococcaceae bacterium]HPZ72068.1 hypothetical protein [Peptococcaceae bacterium]HQD54691.1 hypothetical protein [Peptococcaceae bacterium]